MYDYLYIYLNKIAKLPYSGIYLFVSAELAQIALQYFPNLKAIDDLNDLDTINSNLEGNVQFQICYQVYFKWLFY